MYRTRDFVLVLTSVAFLLTAIGVTVSSRARDGGQQNAELKPAAGQSTEYSAVIENSHTFSRAEKLQSMRDKIAASGQLSIIAPGPIEASEELADTASSTPASELTDEVQLCPGYAVSNVAWSPIGVQIEEAEGIRLVYRSKESPSTAAEVTTSNNLSANAISQREPLAQLPIRNFPAARSSCIQTDIVGIATDGSLIRNNEVSLYGIFSSNTLVGWALDGFPIYGSAASTGDTCGGVTASDGYRYQISSQRDTIINCFSASPIRL